MKVGNPNLTDQKWPFTQRWSEVGWIVLAMRAGSIEPRRNSWLELASGQHGAVSRSQLLAQGLSSASIGRLVSAGRLVPLWRGIYAAAGQPITHETRLKGATLLASNAHASHRAAASLWKLIDDAPVEITVPTVIKANDVVVHRRRLGRRDITVVDGIATTSPHRTLIDLGDVVGDDVVEDALDRALEKKLTSPDWLTKELHRVGTQGKKGPAVLRSLLVKRDGGKPPTWLERRFIRLLEKAPIPSYLREFEVARYRIDFAWPEVLLGVEVHGAKWHKKRLQWEKDLDRHNVLTAEGWTVLHFTWEQIRTQPEVVISEIVAVYRRLRGWTAFSR